jgi:hypothetical protein
MPGCVSERGDGSGPSFLVPSAAPCGYLMSSLIVVYHNFNREGLVKRQTYHFPVCEYSLPVNEVTIHIE